MPMALIWRNIECWIRANAANNAWEIKEICAVLRAIR